MIIEMFLAALIGGAIGVAELAARYRDKPVAALLSPGGLLFALVALYIASLQRRRVLKG